MRYLLIGTFVCNRPMRFQRFAPQALLYFASILILFFEGISQSDDSIEAKIDELSVPSIEGNGEEFKAYVADLGPGIVPVISKKLLQSLREQASPEASKETTILLMPPSDQRRARQQAGLIELQGIALERMVMDPQVREEARKAIFLALRSPYEYARRAALGVAGDWDGADVEDQMLLVLSDSAESNRVIAMRILSKIGNAETAAKIENVMTERRKGMTPQQIEEDWSFRDAEQAIKELKGKNPAHKVSTGREMPPVSVVPVTLSEPTRTSEGERTGALSLTKMLLIFATILVGFAFILWRFKRR